MPHTQRIQGVVFDLDGVLVDSMSCHRAAFEEVLGSFGVTRFEYRRYAGWRTPEVFADIFMNLALPNDEATVRAAAARKSELARIKLAQQDPIFPDCLSVLRRLAQSYRLALASSGARASVELFLNRNQCNGIFRSVLSGDDVINAKPDPEIYHRSFEALKLEPDLCAVVEDAVSGIEAARHAGAAVIGITGICSAEQLRAAGASSVAERLSALPDLLSSL